MSALLTVIHIIFWIIVIYLTYYITYRKNRTPEVKTEEEKKHIEISDYSCLSRFPIRDLTIEDLYQVQKYSFNETCKMIFKIENEEVVFSCIGFPYIDDVLFYNDQFKVKFEGSRFIEYARILREEKIEELLER